MEKIKIINQILHTLDLIPVSGEENHERILGAASGLRTLRQMILQEDQAQQLLQAEAPEDEEATNNG